MNKTKWIKITTKLLNLTLTKSDAASVADLRWTPANDYGSTHLVTISLNQIKKKLYFLSKK